MGIWDFFTPSASYLNGGQEDDWVGCSGNGFTLQGASGNDWVGATGTSNTLDGGVGNDRIVLGVGAHTNDVIIYNAFYGNDRVENFLPADNSVISMQGWGILNFGQLQQYISQDGANTVIKLGGDVHVLTLENVNSANLAANDFLFG